MTQKISTYLSLPTLSIFAALWLGWLPLAQSSPLAGDKGAVIVAQAAQTAPSESVVQNDIDPIAYSEKLVQKLYENYALAERGSAQNPLAQPDVSSYFTEEVVEFLTSEYVHAHPLYGAQDYEVVVSQPKADPEQPMLRGMVTINVDFTNFGHPQRAVFYLRADTSKSDAPFRIFRVEHEGWAYP